MKSYLCLGDSRKFNDILHDHLTDRNRYGSTGFSRPYCVSVSLDVEGRRQDQHTPIIRLIIQQRVRVILGIHLSMGIHMSFGRN